MKNFLFILLIALTSNLFSQISFTSTKNWSGSSVSVDGNGSGCTAATLPTVSFAASDFGGCTGVTYSITDVNVFIGWCKMDGTCAAPGAGSAYHNETNFCLVSPFASNVNLVNPGTYSSNTALTERMDTWFDQAAGSVIGGVTPVDGTFRPNNGNLNTINGTSPIGVWNVRPGDTGGGDPLCVNQYQIQVTATVIPPGNPAVFGSNQWNVYAYDGNDYNLGGGVTYYGNYVEPLLSFDSRNRWGSSNSPADASGYQGCDPGDDTHTVVSKRQGFPCNVYQINVTNHDDNARLYINGVSEFDHAGCCDSHSNVWTGVLSSSDQIEFRHGEGGGGSHQGLTFNVVTTTLNGGTITAPGTIVACGTLDPSTIGSSAAASGGASAAITNGSTTYQWQLNGSNIGGATSATYNPPSLTAGTYVYRRVATDKCGTTANSNSVTITVDAAPIAANNTTTTTAICEGSTKSLTGTPGGGSWSVISGSGSISGSTYNTGSIASDENVTIRYTIAAVGSCPATISEKTFTVNNDPGAANNTTSTATICETSVKSLTGTPGGGSWSLVSGSGTISGSSYDPGSIAADESVTIKYTIIASGACPATESEVTFDVQNAPEVAINTTTNALICEGVTKSLTGTPPGGSWNLLSGSGTIVGSTYNTGVIAADESVFIEYVIAAVGSCPSTNSLVVFNVRNNSTAPTIDPVPGTICTNTSITLTASGGVAGVGSDVYWYSGPGGTGTLLGVGYSVNVTPNVTTTYYARREGGCNTTSDATVIVNVKAFAYTPSGTTSSVGYCTDDNGWHHFYNSSDEIIFSILGDLSGAVFLPQVDITNNGSFYSSLGTPVACASNMPPGEASFEMQRNWNVNFIGTLNPPYKVRFYHDAAEKVAIETAANSHIVTYPACVYSYKYPVTSGFYWFKNTGLSYAAPQYDSPTHLSGSTGATVNGLNFAEIGGISSFSGGSGGIILSPLATLPVELLTFDATPINNEYIQLNWITATEINNDGFELLRSTDGKKFEKIAWIKGNGNTNQKQVYSFNDTKVSNGIYYYKLKQIDFDGEFEDFNVVSALLNSRFENTDIVIRPIPTSNIITLDVVSVNTSNSVISVYNYSGEKVLELNKELIEGKNSLTIDVVSNLSSGIYYINLIVEDKVFTKKFVVSK